MKYFKNATPFYGLRFYVCSATVQWGQRRLFWGCYMTQITHTHTHTHTYTHTHTHTYKHTHTHTYTNTHTYTHIHTYTHHTHTYTHTTHTHTHTPHKYIHPHTHVRTPLYEWSARRKFCKLHDSQQTQEKNILALSGVRTLHPRRCRPRHGYRDRMLLIISLLY